MHLVIRSKMFCVSSKGELHIRNTFMEELVFFFPYIGRWINGFSFIFSASVIRATLVSTDIKTCPPSLKVLFVVLNQDTY